VFGGLSALRAIVKWFEYADKDARCHLDSLADTIFPIIEDILVSLLEIKTEEGIWAKSIIVEILKKSNMMGVLKWYLEPENLDKLIFIMK